MPTPQRRVDPSLIEHSRNAPERYEFFQLVRLYERLFLKGGGDPVSERIRFRNSLRLGFAPSQIDAVSLALKEEEGEIAPERVEVTPSFIGMLGTNGTLPIHYTERVIYRERYNRDTAGRAFLDMFTNRSVGYFYRAWKKYKLPLLYETDRRNGFLPLLLSLTGVGFGALRERMSRGRGKVVDESLAYFSGLIRQRPVSAEALKRVLEAYFQVNVKIEQFVGRWYMAPSEQRSMLGSRNAILGTDAFLGERVWQRNLRIRIYIGPLSYQRYLAFLPRGELAGALGKILEFATGGQFEYEICPVLRAADVCPVSLGGRFGAQLGYDCFVLTRPDLEDRTDIRYLARLS